MGLGVCASTGVGARTPATGRPSRLCLACRCRWLRCEEPTKSTAAGVATCSAPSCACVAGPAANIFVTHGGDDDYALDAEEALEAEAALREVLHRQAPKCALPGVERATACFAQVVTAAEGVLTRVRYQSAWLPCVLKGLREECRLRLCQDP